MIFSSHFPALEALAETKLAERASGMTTTKEIASTLDLRMPEAVGVYEAYNKQEKRRFDFAREFSRDHASFDWHVTIKRL